MADYKDYIVSTKEYETFLHRTFRDSVPGILERGLRTSIPGNIQSTATWQPHELNKADNMYRIGKDHGDAVVVIQIPADLWSIARKVQGRGEEVCDSAIGYFENGNFIVKPEFGVAWIDRTNDKVHLKGEKE